MIRPQRRMLDGTPCWCISSTEPHIGWIHAPICSDLRRGHVRADMLDVTPPDDDPPRAGMREVYVAFAIGVLLILAGAAVLIGSRPAA